MTRTAADQFIARARAAATGLLDDYTAEERAEVRAAGSEADREDAREFMVAYYGKSAGGSVLRDYEEGRVVEVWR